MSAEIFIFAGAVILLSAWLPLVLNGSPLSLPMIAVAAGWIAPVFTGIEDPLVTHGGVIEHVTEIVLLSAIYGAGLKVDRPFNFRRWGSTWRLLLVVMPLSIAALAALAGWLIQLPLATAVLLGAMLAPTDPVLASDLQLGPPGVGEEGESRFALTTEAALNDGLAFPFVLLGLQLTDGSAGTLAGLGHWFAVDFLFSTLGGVAVGAGVGIGLVQFNRILPEKWRLHVSNSGLAGLAVAFVTYGICELLEVNGFVAVFCEAVAVRNTTQGFDYAQRLSHAAAQIERAVMVFVMLFFGFALSHGLLDGTRLELVAFAAAALLIVRPVATAIGFLGSGQERSTRTALGYFGIRGIGSIYYAAYVVAHHPIGWSHDVLTTTALTVLLSVVLYGATSPFAIRRLLPGGG